MEGKRTDRRIRKTKARLFQALMTLMQEKDIKDISVKELSDLADINRGTFYLHYRDVYDMLEQLENEIFIEFNVILDKTFVPDSEDALYSMLSDLFLFLGNNRLMGKTLLGPHGDLSFVNRMKDLVKDRIIRLWKENKQPSEVFDYYYAFVTSGCIGLIETWLGKEQPEPPEKIAKLVESIIRQGLSPLFPAPICHPD